MQVAMTLRIRLARVGSRTNPFYRINVANSFAPRNGRFVAHLGMYRPVPEALGHAQDVGAARGIKRLALDFGRTRQWLAAGAEPTSRVAYLLGIVHPLVSHVLTRRQASSRASRSHVWRLTLLNRAHSRRTQVRSVNRPMNRLLHVLIDASIILIEKCI